MNRTIGRITLVDAPDEQETMDLIASACERAVRFAHEMWGLESPENCRIYVMTSWFRFVFQSAPWYWQMLLESSMPFWCFRARRTWQYSAAWTLRYGKRVVIGVKPPRLLSQTDRSVGMRIFEEEKDMRVTVQNVTCHELVHACSAYLRLPAWLNEGIAIVTVDRFSGSPTIRPETLSFMERFEPKATPPTYRALSRMGLDAIAYHSVRGYWLVRYLEEKHPGFLKREFLQNKDAKTIGREIIIELGMEPERFWMDIDRVVVDYLKTKV